MFDEDTFQASTNVAEMSDLEDTLNGIEMTKRSNFFNVIDEILLMHQGPLHEFTLFMEEADD